MAVSRTFALRRRLTQGLQGLLQGSFCSTASTRAMQQQPCILVLSYFCHTLFSNFRQRPAPGLCDCLFVFFLAYFFFNSFFNHRAHLTAGFQSSLPRRPRFGVSWHPPSPHLRRRPPPEPRRLYYVSASAATATAHLPASPSATDAASPILRRESFRKARLFSKS